MFKGDVPAQRVPGANVRGRSPRRDARRPVRDLQVPGKEVLQLPLATRGQDIAHPVPMEGAPYPRTLSVIHEAGPRHGVFRGLDHRFPERRETYRSRPVGRELDQGARHLQRPRTSSPADPAAVKDGERRGMTAARRAGGPPRINFEDVEAVVRERRRPGPLPPGAGTVGRSERGSGPPWNCPCSGSPTESNRLLPTQ